MPIVRPILLRASRSAWLSDQFTKRTVTRRAVRRFMPGEEPGDALSAAASLSECGIATVLTHLGEAIESPDEAADVRDHYLALLEDISSTGLDVQISVKPTQLGLGIDDQLLAENVLEIVDAAGLRDTVVWIDMEESFHVESTITLYEAVRARSPNVGICLQAYLYRTKEDVERLLPIDPSIRLVKGAYREPASVAYPKKVDTDAAYLSLTMRLLESGGDRAGSTVLGTHDMSLVDQVLQEASREAIRKRRAGGTHAVWDRRLGSATTATGRGAGPSIDQLRATLVPLVHEAAR
jgi:proline dehydrogenase